MKKLTAGIFATILGLTAVDAFAAVAGTTVASTNYVKQAMQAAQTAAIEAAAADATKYIDATELETSQTAQDTSLKAWVGEQGYVTTTQMGEQGFATTGDVATAKQEAIEAAAADATKYIDATELETSQTAQDTSLKAWVGEQGYVTTTQMGEQGFATTGDVATAKQEAIEAAAADATKYIDATELETSQTAQDAVLKKYTDDAVSAINTSMGNLGDTYVAWSYVDDDYTTPGIQ